MVFTRTIPALPVRDISAATDFYSRRLGFTVVFADDSFARLVRDDAEIHLWAADDSTWATRPDFVDRPVRSGAEHFLAGTASCRIAVDGVDEVYAEMTVAGVLHYRDTGAPVDTAWGTREFHTSDLDGNLLTFYEVTG
jgi:catechol 2,3-dioxygenase-like lactoylglutathione lyase family enzyme